ncbi:imidazoleglycerol-phosphate dehydratase HisB [Phytomonospora sp. NPDC050363]|uniref:imidazoleglycerol-phosphate dehydratase HisB n=1 Tax=Phytomonospora sp. NPDC050363 TaxID=3155642 RepID=UPI0034052940
MSRTAVIERKTGETKIRVALDLDTPGAVEVSTGVGFFDHMLHQLGKHGGFGLSVQTDGDLHIDAHHSLEDTAIAVGQAFAEALGDKAGVRRFGDATVPLDEVAVRAVVDLSGRPYVVHEEPLDLAPMIGPQYPTSMTRHIWESFGHHARITLHVSVIRASNPGQKPDAHHVVEAQFKAVARALRDAVRLDGTAGVPSTKGIL